MSFTSSMINSQEGDSSKVCSFLYVLTLHKTFVGREREFATLSLVLKSLLTNTWIKEIDLQDKDEEEQDNSTLIKSPWHHLVQKASVLRNFILN